MMSVEDVVRRETFEQADQGGDCWSVVAAPGALLRWNVAPVGLVRDAAVCRRKRVVDPRLHQARQFCQCRHGDSGGWLVRGASFRALAQIRTEAAAIDHTTTVTCRIRTIDLPPVHM